MTNTPTRRVLVCGGRDFGEEYDSHHRPRPEVVWRADNPSLAEEKP